MRDFSPDELKRFIPNTSITPEGIKMPGESTDETTWSMGKSDNSDLRTVGIQKALVADELKNVLLRESTDVKVPSYMLDITNIEIAEAALLAIKGLLPGGNTAVYMKNGSSIVMVGSGDDYVLYTVLEEVLKEMFNSKCKVYKNNGNGFKPIGKLDVSSVRLNL